MKLKNKLLDKSQIIYMLTALDFTILDDGLITTYVVHCRDG